MNRGITLNADERADIEDIACLRCCNQRCLHSKVQNPPGMLDNSVKLILQCRRELEGLSKKEIYYKIHDIVDSFCVELLSTGVWKHNFVIGSC